MVTWMPDAHERADRHRAPAHHLRHPAAGERAVQPGVAADRGADRAVLPRRRHAGRVRGDRRDPVRRLPARLPHRGGGAGAHPLRRRTQHPARRGAASLGTGGRCSARSGSCWSRGWSRCVARLGGLPWPAGAGARRHRLVHRRGRHVRRASGQRASAQAPGGRDAGGRVRRQRSRRGHPDHHARLQPPGAGAPRPGRDAHRDRHSAGDRGRGRNRRRLRRPRAHGPAPADDRRPVPGADARGRLPLLRGGNAGRGQRVPGGVPRGDRARQRSPALSRRSAAHLRRARLAGPDRDVPAPGAAGVPLAPAARWRDWDSASHCCWRS